MQYPSPEQPLAVKLVNRMGRGLGGVGVLLPSLSPDKLIAKARKQTGLNDFGNDDFRLGLEKLCGSLQEEARLSQIGRIAAHGMLLANLKIRLQLTDYRKFRPEVAQQKIKRPLFVLGLPRTGTTILYELLAQDPAHRSPLSWEVDNPMPPAQEATFTTDPRIETAQKTMNEIEVLAPGFKAIHEIGAQLPQECVALLAPHFISDQFGISFSIPHYRSWTLEQNMSAAYQWHYQFLQHLQVDYSKTRWVLKTPPHLAYLDALFLQYPDAAIVQTHRDPITVMGSISSLACTLHSAFSDEIDPVAVGREEVTYFAEMLRRGMEARDAIPCEREKFFDVQFNELISDPIAVIESIYRHFDFDFSSEAHAAMQLYLDNRPRDKHGHHQYSLEDFGISPEQHGSLFSDYCQRFGCKGLSQ